MNTDPRMQQTKCFSMQLPYMRKPEQVFAETFRYPEGGALGFKELDAIMPQGFKRGEFIMHSAKPSSDGTYPDLGTANKYAQSDNGDQS